MREIKFTFLPQSEADSLPEKTTALVITDEGCLDIAIWIQGKWYNSGSMAYAGGIDGIMDNVVHFSVILDNL